MFPFTAEVLDTLFEHYNRALWPAQLGALVLAVAALGLALRSFRGSGRLIGLLLAAAWAWCGWGFHLERFAQLNFAAPFYGWAFLIQSALLALTLAGLGRVAFRWRGDLFARAGMALALLALVLPPLIAGLVATGPADPGWPAARLVGLAPGPTALFTLALLLLAAPRPPLHLALIPLLWSLLAGFTGWVLTVPEDLATSPLAIVAFGLILWARLGGRREAGVET